jgi:hypothetical protein
MALESFRGESIEHRCRDVGVAVTADERIAMIIAQQQNDIRPFRSPAFRRELVAGPIASEEDEAAKPHEQQRLGTAMQKRRGREHRQGLEGSERKKFMLAKGRGAMRAVLSSRPAGL